MKRTILTLLPFLFIFSSCLKPSDYYGQPDSADAFVGDYSFTGKQTAMVGDMPAEVTSVSGDFSIVKTGANTVQMSGFYNTTGVAMSNFVNFASIVESSDTSTVTLSFTTGFIMGDVLKFTVNGTGQLELEGTAYPYNSTMPVTAVKK